MATQMLLINKVGSLNKHLCVFQREQQVFTDFCFYLGFDSLAAARIFLTLMERLGFSQFYLQGGDWGSLITTNMAQMKPL